MMWLVKHRKGTCALKYQRRTKAPPDGTTSVPTLCEEFVILPLGFSQGTPDCETCLRILKARR
jgi:hypothetical protein